MYLSERDYLVRMLYCNCYWQCYSVDLLVQLFNCLTLHFSCYGMHLLTYSKDLNEMNEILIITDFLFSLWILLSWHSNNVTWLINVCAEFFANCLVENTERNANDSDADCANFFNISMVQHDSQASFAFSAKFDQLAGSIFEHCNEAWNHDGDVYDVPQYPIAERQQKGHIVNEISYR